MQRLILSVIVCLFLAGCGAQKSTFVLLPDPSGKVGTIVVTNAQGTQTLNRAKQSVVVKSKTAAPGNTRTMGENEIHSVFGQALEIQPLPPAKFLLYFRTDSVKLRPGSNSKISSILQTIKDRNSLDISVTGHTDRTAGYTYNYLLSFFRARRIEKLLVKKGVDPAIITTNCHGEGNPLIPTRDNIAEPRNRRVEVTVR